jgi:hypothetical protein
MSEQHPNFKRLMTGVDVTAAVAEIANQSHLWKLIQVRQQYEGTAHADTETIVIRGPETTEGIFDNLECVDFQSLEALPATLDLIRLTAHFLKAREIGRIMLVRLNAGGWIKPHVDEGAYARYFARFHLAIESNPTCRFRCGEEAVNMEAGELWWFNHQVQHSVVNRGADRTHLIMDLTAPGFTGAMANIRAP